MRSEMSSETIAVEKCPRPRNGQPQKKRGASREAPLSLDVELSLVIQLQSELDLPRVIRSIARGPKFTERGLRTSIGVVRGSGDGDYAVAAESRSVEVGMIKDVKDFRAELQPEALGQRDVLKDGEVQAVESRSWHLCHSTQSAETRQRNAT